MKKYAFIANKNNIKFEIGKRYFLKKYIILFFDSIEDMSHLFLQCKYNKLYEIELFSIKKYFIEDFKIIKEINYKEFLNSNNQNIQILSAIKNHENQVLENFIVNGNNIEKYAVIESGVHKYLDEIIRTNDALYVNEILSKYGRNKDIAKYKNKKSYSYLFCSIIKKIDSKELEQLITKNDFIKENIKEFNPYIFRKKIKKYIDPYLNLFTLSTEEKESIIKTKIDKYLDFFIKDSDPYIKGLIAKQGRKCDLDIFVYDEDEDIRKIVAYRGFDDHLDILEKENNPNINKIINELRGKRE